MARIIVGTRVITSDDEGQTRRKVGTVVSIKHGIVRVVFDGDKTEYPYTMEELKVVDES